MKKTLLAAALIAGFAGVAQAETSVTLYGILDGGIGYQKVSGSSSRSGAANTSIDGKRVGLINGIQSGNRWGLKGSEDLGSGLRAVFVLESGFTLADGRHAQNDRLFGRQATLGLAGDSWGQLDFGRQTNISSKYLAAADPFGEGFDQANIGVAFTTSNTTRYDNMVMYQTPNFSGFQLGVGYSFNVDGSQSWDRDTTVGGIDLNTKDSNKKALTTGLRYANGPLAVALTYDQVKSGSSVTGGTYTLNPTTGAITLSPAAVSDNVTIKSLNLGGSFDFEVAKLHLAIGQTRDGLFQSQTFGDNATIRPFTGLDGLKVNSYLVGATVPLGNGSLLASWTMADPTDKPDSAGVNDEWDKQQTYSVGYTYGLSKRTNLYAIGSYAKHIHFLPDAKSTLVGVGVRHQF
ncbi:porin [Pollutimonas bauzanensis]|uniref:Outer membrane protein (Porin) n=1 Tax=Pollutimonas bauzanensis TaxID=658167 RepID=A0A1M5YZI1_9BURK|nr:porin [Pollutimonas bauzanensis]SHI17446.1 Outer membrane protein (porin) [Pollutimonas bauzanensis]